MKKCISYVTASKYNFKDLILKFENNYKLRKYKNFCILEYNKWLSFIFDYWTIINWNLNFDENKKILEEVKEFEIWSIKGNVYEEFFYEENNEWNLKFSNDCIYLGSDSDEEKIWVSHALSQSIKLMSFENSTEKSIEETKNIPLNLAKTWKILMKSKDLSKMRWELFLSKSRVNLHYDLLDSPEFFWEYPELLKYYETIANYLEIKSRIDVLNKKHEVIHELFQMLADEQKHNHSSLLEWIIIWLIVIEVFFTIFHDVLKWF